MDPAAFGPLELGTAAVLAALAWKMWGLIEAVIRDRFKPAPVQIDATHLAEIHKVTTARDSQDRPILWAGARLADAVEAQTQALSSTTKALTSQTTSVGELVVELRKRMGEQQRSEDQP